MTLMDEIKKNILWIVLGIIIFEAYGLVIGIPNGLLLSFKNWMELVGILAEILVLFLFSYAFYKLGKYDFASKITAKNIVFLFLAIAVCLIANFGVSHISMMMHKPMQNNSSVNQILSIISTKRFAFRPFFWCLNVGIIVPFLEEIVFRGIIQGYVFESLNAAVRIIAISVLFTIGHGVEFSLAMIPIFSLGLCTSLLFEKTKDIKMPIILHIVFNCAAITATFLGA